MEILEILEAVGILDIGKDLRTPPSTKRTKLLNCS